MATPNTVKIVEVLKVAPPSNSTPEFFLPLTHFDILFLKISPVNTLYFFKLSETESTPTYFYSKIVPTLNLALSQTLLHFLPVAGNLTWPSDHQSSKPIIAYTPKDSVTLTVAESRNENQDFDLFTGNEVREAGKSYLYLPNLLASDAKAALLALQITLFPNKGFSVGMAAHHVLLDGLGTCMFLKAWAYICNEIWKNGEKYYSPSLLQPQLTPCFDRSKIKDTFSLGPVYLNQWGLAETSPNSDSNHPRLSLKSSSSPLPPNLYRANFQLTHEDIRKVREMVLSYQQLAAGPNPIKKLHLSTFVLTYSYVAVCVLKARGGDYQGEVYMPFVVDCRNRLDSPLPPNYLGNCHVLQHLVIESGVRMEGNGVFTVAEKLGDLIKGFEKYLFEGVKERLKLVLSLGPEVPLISASGSTNMDLYKLDFGWGRVQKVEITPMDLTKAISILPSGDEGGVEIGVVLSKQEMADFASHFYNGLRCEQAKL